MSIPSKHHFLPEFYLRRWAGDDGRVVEYRRIRGRLIRKRRYPAGTGYQRDLYTIRSRRDPAQRQALESRFMAPLVDDLAAQALEFMLTHATKPEPRLRDGWSRFLMSLMHRAPHRLGDLRKLVLTEDVIRTIEASYDELRTPEHPPSFEEYMAEKGESIADEALETLLLKIMDSVAVGNVLNTMEWNIADSCPPACGLLTGDSPLVITGPLGHPDASILLAVSPTSFFMASNSVEALRRCEAARKKIIESALNEAVVAQSKHLIVAADESQERFIDNRFLRGQQD